MVTPSLQYLFFRRIPGREPQTGTAKRSLLALYPPPCFLLHARLAAALRPRRELVVQVALPERRRQGKTSLCRIT